MTHDYLSNNFTGILLLELGKRITILQRRNISSSDSVIFGAERVIWKSVRLQEQAPQPCPSTSVSLSLFFDSRVPNFIGPSS